MFTIQVFIKDDNDADIRVDLFKDESVTLTQSIQNVRDISSVFTDFTRTFNIPASQNTNKLFKHYYNSDVVNNNQTLSSAFDARKRRSARIELNHTPFKKGNIRLDGVNMKDNKPYTYRITFFGETVNLKTLMGDDQLSSLNLASYNTIYSDAEIRTKLTSAIGDVIAPLITHTRRLVFNSNDNGTNPIYSGVVDNIAEQSPTKVDDNRALSVRQLKYAIRVHRIIEAIQSKYNLTFSTDFINTTNLPYYNLYLWMHRKKGDLGTGEQIEKFSTYVDGWQDEVDGDIEIKDDVVIIPTGLFSITAFKIETECQSQSSVYDVEILRNGIRYDFIENQTGDLDMNFITRGLTPQPGSYTVIISVKTTQVVFTNIQWSINYYQTSSSSINLVRFDTSDVGNFTATANPAFIISNQIPEIKNIDFLTGLFKMFNLTAFVEDDGTIKIQTLDSFYSGGVDHNITEYIDISESAVNVALPFKEIDLRYQGTGAFYAKTHEQIFNEEWGTERFLGFEEDIDGEIFKLEVPFEHHKFQRLLNLNNDTNTSIQWGWSADDNQESYIGKPLLFYPVRVTSGDSIQLKDSSGSAFTTIQDYIVPSNSVELNNTSQSINFRAELNEYTNTISTNGLFKTYYTKYLTDVFDSKNRLTKVTAFLPAKVLLNFTLADRFIINQRSYKINSITTDMYNGKSEIELLNDFNA
jgi:hypothetical protein